MKPTRVRASFILSAVVGCFVLFASLLHSCDLRPSLAMSLGDKKGPSEEAKKLGEEWGKDATPGVSLQLVEWKGPTVSKLRKNDVAYQLVSAGFPQGKTYNVWMLESGEKIPAPFLPGGSADAKGELPIGVPIVYRDLVRAEPVDMAVVSTDMSVRAFVSAIPFPIKAQDGRCSASLRIVNKDLQSFQILLEGFPPDEDIKTVSRFEGDVSEGALKVSSDGKSSVLVGPKTAAKRSGKASFEAVGKSCHPELQYEWGRRSYFRF